MNLSFFFNSKTMFAVQTVLNEQKYYSLDVLQKTFFINLFFSYPSLSILKETFSIHNFNWKSFINNNFHCNKQISPLAECTSESMLDRSMPTFEAVNIQEVHPRGTNVFRQAYRKILIVIVKSNAHYFFSDFSSFVF